MAATALLLPSLSAAAPTAGQRRHHRSPQPQLQLQRGPLACRALRPPLPRRRLAVSAVQETKEGEAKTAEEITEKYGLEFGLWKVFISKEEEGGEGKKKSRTDQAKELLAKYGGAYLATSISLSLVSFTLCYLLISAGVDVQDLLAKVRATQPAAETILSVELAARFEHWQPVQVTNGSVLSRVHAQVGIATGETGGKVGTFALAYAAHKAASPIRFPPTVALTPVVAGWLGKIRKGDD
ncbi:uncharacterized protein C2845_PM15G07880 [Panicum miliaceum]|uniref:DUF1279 domain-containing protein n=1 Tax=Panicum miliaceum TaxID=4540 RepID=A0A3L6Q697_PANMI|nr:uncharacterized protein C2845_PM15G07880 [Panicum miliaceum]